MNDVLREWIEKADGDFVTANREFAVADHPNHDAVCFHAQQCIEKLLKAVIIAQGITPPKTHDLAQLHRLLATTQIAWAPKVQDLNFLTRAAVDFRYPGESADQDEAKESIAICTQLRSELLALLPKCEPPQKEDGNQREVRDAQ